MTDPKPFTAEQLDRIETASKFLAQSPEEHEVMLRLIAQTREEIRLQGVIEAVAAFLRNGPPAATVERREVLRFICYEQQASVDPAARAKRELGEWLAEREFRMYVWMEHSERFGPAGRFQLSLRDCGRHIEGERCATKSEAITAALRAAKESGR